MLKFVWKLVKLKSFAKIDNIYYIIYMKINIVCVGKIKEKFYLDAIAEYKKRLSKFCKLNIIEVNAASNIDNLEKKSEAEGKSLLAKCSGVVVCLDLNGKQFSSTELADFIHEKQVLGCSEISFVIGGSNGLSNEILFHADAIVSFGKITFPHQLFRVVLTEQIYRAITIINGLPYHK